MTDASGSVSGRGADEIARRIDVTKRLLAHCRSSGWAGHDPYDALNSQLLVRLPILDRRVPRLVLTQLLKRLPWNLRPLLAIPKSQNAKALALCVSALVKLSKIGLVDGLDEAEALAARLVEMRSDNGRRDCWGYNFPWQTRTVLVPRGAPNLVCTIFVAEALLDLHEATGREQYLSLASGAARYIVDELHWRDDKGVHSLAYPLPTSRVPVHNANLLGAALLCRVASALGTGEFIDVALDVARYSVARQRADGSWLYGEASTQGWIDNFHTGFNLSALASIGRSLATTEFEQPLRLGFDFYRKHFVRPDGAARYFHDKTFPIDIHCVAQSVITLLEFRHLHAQVDAQAASVMRWAIDNMWDVTGYFYYRSLPLGRVKIPYFRWSQAWMLFALACALQVDSQSHGWPSTAVGSKGISPSRTNDTVGAVPEEGVTS